MLSHCFHHEDLVFLASHSFNPFTSEVSVGRLGIPSQINFLKVSRVSESNQFILKEEEAASWKDEQCDVEGYL